MKKTFALFRPTFLAGALLAGSGKLAKELESLDPDSNVNVIVQFKHPPTGAHHQRIRSRGGLHKRSLDLIKRSLYSVPAGAMEELTADR